MAARTISGRKATLLLLGVMVFVVGGFAGLALWNLEKIRTSVAIRRWERPVLKQASGEMVIVPEGEFQVPAGQAAPRLQSFYIDRRETPAGVTCESLGKREATREELAKAARGATAENDESIYGVLGLAGGAQRRCAMAAGGK